MRRAKPKQSFGPKSFTLRSGRAYDILFVSCVVLIVWRSIAIRFRFYYLLPTLMVKSCRGHLSTTNVSHQLYFWPACSGDDNFVREGIHS